MRPHPAAILIVALTTSLWTVPASAASDPKYCARAESAMAEAEAQFKKTGQAPEYVSVASLGGLFFELLTLPLTMTLQGLYQLINPGSHTHIFSDRDVPFELRSRLLWAASSNCGKMMGGILARPELDLLAPVADDNEARLGDYALYLSMRSCSLNTFQQLIANPNLDPQFIADGGISSFSYAVIACRGDDLRSLIQLTRKTRPEAIAPWASKRDERGFEPIALAASPGQLKDDTIDVLLAEGIYDSHGLSQAFARSAKACNTKRMEKFARFDQTDLNARMAELDERPAFSLAIEACGPFEVQAFLQWRGRFDPNLVDGHGTSPAMIATTSTNREVLDLLLDSEDLGVDFNSPSQVPGFHGEKELIESPLTYALFIKRDVNLANLLLASPRVSARSSGAGFMPIVHRALQTYLEHPSEITAHVFSTSRYDWDEKTAQFPPALEWALGLEERDERKSLLEATISSGRIGHGHRSGALLKAAAAGVLADEAQLIVGDGAWMAETERAVAIDAARSGLKALRKHWFATFGARSKQRQLIRTLEQR